MPAKVEAVVLQVNTRGLRKYAEALVGLAGTHRYSRVQACANINLVLRLVIRSFNGWSELPQYLILVNIKSTCYEDIQYSRINFTQMLRIAHFQGDKKLSVEEVF